MDILNGQKYRIVNEDCIEHMATMPKHSIDMSVFSPPFPALYAYTSSEADIGNSEDLRTEAKLKNINAYETYEELKAKIAYDAELFNGFAVEVIWNKAKTAPSEYYHIPFKDVRKGLEGEYVYCADWTDTKAEKIHYQPYNPITRESKQLYYCQFYRPGEGTYPLPDYVGALKYIEVDTEISNYYLNSIKNGFTAQTHIQLFKGIPTPEEARATARRFKENYQGTDNAGGLIIQYNDPTEKVPPVITQMRQQRLINNWLHGWTEAFRQVLSLTLLIVHCNTLLVKGQPVRITQATDHSLHVLLHLW